MLCLDGKIKHVDLIPVVLLEGDMYHLTADQYRILSDTAHKICVTVHHENKGDSGLYVDMLADFVSVLTGTYPERDVLYEAWGKAEELDGRGSERDINIIIEIFIGDFIYDRDSTSEDEAREEMKNLTEEQIEFLETVKNSSTPEKCAELFKGIHENLEYIGPSTVDTGRGL